MQTLTIKKPNLNNHAFVIFRGRLNSIHPLWRTIVNFPLILLKVLAMVQSIYPSKDGIVLKLEKDTANHHTHSHTSALAARECIGSIPEVVELPIIMCPIMSNIEIISFFL